MSPSRLTAAIGGWKTGAGVVGGAVTATLVAFGWVNTPVKANTAAIQETRTMAVENRAMIQNQDAKIDRLICYNEEAAAQIQGQNPNFARCSR